jgi:uncharacterized protein
VTSCLVTTTVVWSRRLDEVAVWTERTGVGSGVAEAADIDNAAPESASTIPAHLSMVVLSVRDMPALRDYYRALGWQEQPGASDALSIFELGGAALALHPQSDPVEASDRSEADRTAVTFVVRVGSASEVDAACFSAERAGARPVSGPQDQPWGGRSALVADPEGNRWELLWVPSQRNRTSPG